MLTMIEREEAKINAALDPWRARLKGKRVLLYTGGVKSWSVVSIMSFMHGASPMSMPVGS